VSSDFEFVARFGHWLLVVELIVAEVATLLVFLHFTAKHLGLPFPERLWPRKRKDGSQLRFKAVSRKSATAQDQIAVSFRSQHPPP
jgi:hypothetical protein